MTIHFLLLLMADGRRNRINNDDVPPGECKENADSHSLADLMPQLFRSFTERVSAANRLPPPSGVTRNCYLLFDYARARTLDHPESLC